MRLLACVVIVSLAGCGGERRQGDSHQRPQPQPADQSADGGTAGAQQASGGAAEPSSALDGMGELGALGSLLSAAANKPGPYEEPTESADFSKRKDHYAVLELAGVVADTQAFSLLGSNDTLELRGLTDRLRELASDDDVVGLVIRFGELSVELSAATELRTALLAFKSAGGRERKLVCHASRASDYTFYVMTACDDIGLDPLGSLVVSGPAAVPIHLKGLLDKLGLRADVVHVGAYKGAPEPLTRTAPSAEARETLGLILDRQYETLVAGIAQGRKLSPEQVRKHIDVAAFSDEQAVAAGLVDRVASFDRYRDAATAGAQWHKIAVDNSAEPDLGKLMEFLGMRPLRRPGGDRIVLVYAQGSVIDGKGDGILGARGEIASRTLTAALRALAVDDDVKAVVLRIDSGGGSALASELIWEAVGEVKARKPVVVSMGGVAASGGYYIGCGATKIYALPNTLTGSIGVFGLKLVVGGALAKLGVTTHPMGRGRHALIWSTVEPWSSDERRTIQSSMDVVYERFLARVAEGRGMTRDQVHAVAQGRVWTGADAHDKGLVDALGGLEDALAEARSLASLPADAPIEVYPPEPTLRDIVGSIGEVSARPFGIEALLVTLARELGPREAAAVKEVFDLLLRLRNTHVVAALVYPLVIR